MLDQDVVSMNCALDMLDPQLYTTGDPHAVWRVTRACEPVQWNDHGGFWSVTGYEPARRVLAEWRTFTSTNGTTLRPDMTKPFPGAGKMLVLTDPPRHTEVRRAIAPMFARRNALRIAQMTRKAARRLLSTMAENGECDFVTDVASKIPMTVCAELLAVPADRITTFLAAAEAAASAAATPGGGPAAHNEIMLHYFRMINRDNDGREDIVSAFVRARNSGLSITDEEIILTCDNIAVAASETAVAAASGGLLAMLERPALWQAMRAKQIELPKAVEEILRWTCPATHVLRTAAADGALAGMHIAKGQPVVVWLPAANRDPLVFDLPDELVLSRHPNPHLSFGGGAHFCLGAALARAILSGILSELAESAMRIAIAAPPKWNSSHAVWGLSSLPVALY